MNILYEIVTLILIYAAGIGTAYIIPIPGSLISMILFFILLVFRVLKEEKYTGISTVILRNLSFFFIVPAVKVLDSLDILSGNIFKIVLVIVVSNLLVMAVTGLVVQRMIKGERRDD